MGYGQWIGMSVALLGLGGVGFGCVGSIELPYSGGDSTILSDGDTDPGGDMDLPSGDAWAPGDENESGDRDEPGDSTFPGDIGVSVGEVLWRPMFGRPEEHFGADQVDFPDYYGRGRYSGDGYQCTLDSHWSPSDPRRVIWSQDMGGVRRSDDGGKSWVSLPSIGNTLIGGNAVAIDPEDPDRFLALMSANSPGRLSPDLDELEGLYLSTDAGVTWTLVQPIAEVYSDPRFFEDNFAYWPLSGGEATERTWRVLSMYEEEPKGYGDGSFWQSTDGGQTWRKGPALPVPMRTSKIYALLQHPAREATLFAATSTGLWRTTDAGDAWTRPFNGKIPGESRTVWVDPDAPENLFVNIRSSDAGARGIWHSSNDGSTWTRVFDVDVMNFAVGARDNEGVRTFYVMPNGDKQAWFRDWDGTVFLEAWTRPVVNKGVSTDTYHFTYLVGKSQSHFLPHPTDPNVVLSNGICAYWRSEDRGRTWNLSVTGMGGYSARRIHFNQGDWRELDMAAADLDTLHTSNAGDWFEQSGLTGRTPDGQITRMEAVAGSLNYTSGVDITRLPDDSSVLDPAARGRRIVTIGNLSRHFIFTQDRGQSDWSDFIELPVSEGGGGTYRTFVDYHRQDPNVVYCGPNVSTDGGSSWGRTQGTTSIVGMSMQNGDIVYGADGQKSLLISANRGASWSAYLTTSHPVRINGRAAFWVSPHDYTRTFIRGATGDLTMLTGAPGEVHQTDLGLRHQFAPVPAGFEVAEVAFSGQDERLFYALVDLAGAEVVWIGRFDADYSQVEWTPITKNAPRLSMSSHIHVHPVTGDVFVTGGHGTWVHPPPEGPRAESVWANLPEPFDNGWHSGLPRQ